MYNKKLANKTAKLAMTVVVAGHLLALDANNMVIARILEPDLISSKVWAAEVNVLTGQCIYVQNDTGNPDPVVNVNVDGTLEVGMYLGTMIQLGGTEGSSLQVNAEAGVVAAAVAPDGISILVAGNQVGSQTIQVQNTMTGAATTVVVNVIDAAGAVPTTVNTGVHKGVQNGYYSYADDHKIISADGRLEINLDQLYFLRKTSVPAPVVYYDEDGMLAVDAYNLSGVNAICTITDKNYRFATYSITDNTDGLYSDQALPVGMYAGLGGGDNATKTEVEWIRLRDKNYVETDVLPVRVTSLGSAFSNGADWLPGDEPVTYYPTAFTIK